MLCLNYLNKTVELLFILYNFAIVPSVGTGIKAQNDRIVNRYYHIVPFVGTGIKAAEPFLAFGGTVIVPFMGAGIKIPANFSTSNFFLIKISFF